MEASYCERDASARFAMTLNRYDRVLLLTWSVKMLQDIASHAYLTRRVGHDEG